MAKIVSICAKKGGPGKSTTAFELAAGLLLLQKRVLTIDLDSQCNFTSMCDSFDPELASINEVLMKKCSIRDAIQSSIREEKYKNTNYVLDTVQSSLDLDNVNVSILNEPDRLFRLRQALDEVKNDYDYVIIDTPPAFETLTQMSLCASDKLILVAQASQFDIDALYQFGGGYNQIKSYYNPNLEILGILLTRFSERSNFRREVRDNMSQIAEQLNTSLFNTFIRENVKIPESQANHVSIWKYDKKSNGAKDYSAFLKEVMFRLNDNVEFPEILKSEII